MNNYILSSTDFSCRYLFPTSELAHYVKGLELKTVNLLLANPAFNNKELFKYELTKHNDLNRSLDVAFNHRGITLAQINNNKSSHYKICNQLTETLLNGYYNPFIWDLFTYIISRDFKQIGNFSFTDRGLIVGFLGTDTKGRFEGGEIVLKDGSYSISSEKDITFQLEQLYTHKKVFMAYLPISSIVAWQGSQVKATQAQIVGLTYNAAKMTQLKKKIKEVTNPAEADIIKVPYQFDSQYYTFWSNND